MKVSGGLTKPKKQRKPWAPDKAVRLHDVRRRADAVNNIGAEVEDAPCSNCGTPLIIRRGPEEVFLGCRNYKQCGAAPLFAWKKGAAMDILPEGASLEHGEIVFRYD